MSIEHYFNQAIIIRRLADLGSGKYGFVATGTVDAHIQQRDNIPTNSGEYAIGEITHQAWVDINSNIKYGDKVIDQNNVEYDVLGINEKGRGVAMNEHLEVWLSEKIKGEK